MRKKFLSYVIATIMLFSSTGCGGSSKGSNSSPISTTPIQPPSGETEMTISTFYLVHSGDMVIKTSDPTMITVTHEKGSRTSTVSLVKGSAVIRRQ